MSSTICASDGLTEGKALRFILRNNSGEKPAFVVRHGGRAYAYINECQHLALELDWNPGDFFDLEKQHIICATHGALYQPETGECVSGPCKGARLSPVAIRELKGQINLADNMGQVISEFDPDFDPDFD